MKILEIKLKNPIDFADSKIIETKIRNSKHYHYLLIDFGEHNFKSIGVIKHLREGLKSIEPLLLKFKKIAFVHPSQFKNQSENPDILDFLHQEMKR